MRIVKVIPKVLALSIVLIFPMETLASFDFSSDKIVDGGFDRSDSFDLLAGSELDSHYSNYADVQITGASYNQVMIDQDGFGSGINKARVVIKSGSSDNNVYLSQYGSNNTGLITQDGDGNTALLVQSGNGQEGYILQEGDNNLAFLKQQYKNRRSSSISIEQMNDNNVALVVDRGGSNYSIKQNGGSKIAVWSSMGRHISIEQ